MIHYIQQCKHCGKRYTYQASGEGCFDKYNNCEYCPDCYKAILDALAKIPVKYHPQWVEIEEGKDKILKALSELKEKYKEETKNANFPCAIKMVSYDGDEFVFNQRHYRYNDGKLYIFGECNNKGNYTGKPWIENNIGYDHYIPTNNFYMKAKEVFNDDYKIPEPAGIVFWQDIDNIQTGVDVSRFCHKSDKDKLIDSVKPHKF